MHQVVTIREAISRAKNDGYDISEYALRQWIRTGEIPSRTAGKRKTLIYYPNLVNFITCAGSVTWNCDTPNAMNGGM